MSKRVQLLFYYLSLAILSEPEDAFVTEGESAFF